MPFTANKSNVSRDMLRWSLFKASREFGVAEIRDLTDEQCWKIWLAVDRMRGCNGYDPSSIGYDFDPVPITTPDQAADMIGFIYDTNGIEPLQMEELEELEYELERDEEFKLAGWIRKLRYSRESAEEEQSRYESYDRQAEKLAKQRRRRRPRN